ncbi:MAG: glycan-binding surface protein [Paludibacteraceae bacterium]|nr:glycan-binding surface protein [Paludibacteraceae bacterium]
MKIGLKIFTYAAIAVAAVVGAHFVVMGLGKPSIEVNSMECEYVLDGEEAIFKGKGLLNCQKVVFPGNKEGRIVSEKTNDSLMTVEVPHGTAPGKILFFEDSDKPVVSNFLFRDNRGMIIDFDTYLATWGGYDPLDDEGGPIKVVMDKRDSVLVLPTTPPEQISGAYILFYQRYNEPWTMEFPTFLQYVAKPDEGGRGRKSIAGDNATSPIGELCLKFEVNIPKECAWKKQPRIEIFFGPYDCSNKHGREISPIAFWEPYLNAGEEGYYTDGWKTVSIPLTAFTHDYRNADAKFDKRLNLKEATNFSFVCMGDPGEGSTSEIFMALDNFRVVPDK